MVVWYVVGLEDGEGFVGDLCDGVGVKCMCVVYGCWWYDGVVVWFF